MVQKIHLIKAATKNKTLLSCVSTQALLCWGVPAMTDVEASFEDFTASGRTGRRNAIYEIPQGLGGPGPAESGAAASAVSGNKSGEERKLVNQCQLFQNWEKILSVVGCHSNFHHKVELKIYYFQCQNAKALLPRKFKTQMWSGPCTSSVCELVHYLISDSVLPHHRFCTATITQNWWPAYLSASRREARHSRHWGHRSRQRGDAGGRQLSRFSTRRCLAVTS